MQRSNERFVERLPLVLPRPVYGYALSLLLCLLAWLARVAAETLLPVGYPFVTFFPAVILSSFLFGVRPGIFAAIIGGLLSWYCFIPPFYALAFNPGVAMALIFYTMVVAVDILLIHFMQRANFNLAVERERIFRWWPPCSRSSGARSTMMSPVARWTMLPRASP
jgi:K+-sensing histidine kinase KdpD